MITIVIKLTHVGEDAGPFDIYTNADGFVTPIAQNISKSILLSGYACVIDETKTTIIRITSTGVCGNHFDIPYNYDSSLYTYINQIDEEGVCGIDCINSLGSISINGDIAYSWSGFEGGGESGILNATIGDEISVYVLCWHIDGDYCSSIYPLVNIYINDVLVASIPGEDTYTFTVDVPEFELKIDTTCIWV